MWRLRLYNIYTTTPYHQKKRVTPYVILLEYGTTAEKSYDDLVQASRYDASPSKLIINAAALEVIPHFLSWFQINNGPQRSIPRGIHKLLPWGWIPVHSQTEFKFQKGRFYCTTSQLQKALDYPPGRWNIFPGHSTVSSFLKSVISFKNSLSLNYFSAKHIIYPCPPSLYKSLDPSNPDRQVLLNSYNEEKRGLIDHEV